MNLLWLLVFGVLGIILDKAFGYQVERSKSHKKSPWYSKLLDMILIAVVLIGLIICVDRFPLGLLGLIVGAILGWAMFNDTAANESVL